MLIGSIKTRLLILAGGLVVALTYLSVAWAEHEPRLIIFGDSLSTTLESWPNHLRRIAPRWNIHLQAQNGRTIRDFSIPRDLRARGDRNETVIYFLGSADILQRNHAAHAGYRLKTHINFLLERNFKVLLIVPPHLKLDPEKFHTADEVAKSNEEHRKMIESYRGTHPNLCVYDLDNVWDPSQTVDGIHPTSTLSYEIALVINMVLGMNIY